MKCPLRVSYWGESRESNCHPDCAWRVANRGSKRYCAIAMMSSSFGGGPFPVNFELADEDANESGDAR